MDVFFFLLSWVRVVVVWVRNVLEMFVVCFPRSKDVGCSRLGQKKCLLCSLSLGMLDVFSPRSWGMVCLLPMVVKT